MIFLIAHMRRLLLEKMSFRWIFLFEFFSSSSALLVFWIVDRFQHSYLENQLSAATESLGTSYFGYVALGLAVSHLSSANIGGVLWQFQQEKRLETLPFIIGSPIGILGWAISAGVANIGRALFQFISIFLVANIVMHNMLHFSLLNLMFVLLIAVPSLWALSVISLCFALLLRRGDPLGFILGILFEFCSGVYAPISIMPDWMIWLSKAIPLTPVLQASQKIVYQQETLYQVRMEVFHIIIFTIILLPIAIVLIRWSEKKAKLSGIFHLS